MGESDELSASWVFERTGRMGGAAGEAFTNTLAAPDMRPEHVLGREAIQNSADAAATKESKVLVRFRSIELSGNEKAQFVDCAGLKSLAARREFLNLSEPNCLPSLDDGAETLQLVYVDDYETTGLEGDPKDDNSKFFRFLLTLGDGSKVDEHGTGGSFGFGKSVYSSNSRILTIFAYSRTLDETKAPQSLLFGCSYFRKHRVDGKGFSGRAWFGIDETADVADAEQGVAPLQGARADSLATQLGFAARGVNELGTSVLLIDSSLAESELLRGVEDWWWPRLISGNLDVEIIGTSGDVLVPRPRKRPDLKPFLDAFEIAIGSQPPKTGASTRKVFNQKYDLGMGMCAIRVLEKTIDDEYPVSEEMIDSVAIVRAPRMVVQYYRNWTPGNPATVGVYLADEDVDDILKMSEPPTHNLWDPTSARLRDADGRKRDVVDTILRRIGTELKRFQKQASPPSPPKTRRLAILERALASYLSPSKAGGGDGVAATAAPISLQYEQEPFAFAAGDKGLKMQARFAVRLKADAEMDNINVRVQVDCMAVADGGGEGEEIPVSTVCDKQDLQLNADQPNLFAFPLKKGEVVRFLSETSEYDASWTVKFVPEVEPVQ